ncbi:IclR family transcriptional regulator [Ideonella sp.]|uniref:IclR family transcriptional regulator n=1 Tax=Ideonella sp. TaxID=1929293 RepID=UPI003BB57268
MSRKTTYTSSSQQRLLKVLMALFADVVTGVPGTVLAQAAGCSPSAITRDLDNLRTAGLAERDEETGLWRLTPRLPQQAVKVFNAVERAGARYEQARNRYTRNPD